MNDNSNTMPLCATYERKREVGNLPSLIWRIMKLTLLLTLLFTFQVSADILAQKVNLNLRNASFRSVMVSLQKQTDYSFIAKEQLLRKANPVSVNIQGKDIQEVLPLLFEGQPFTYEVNGKVITLKQATNEKNRPYTVVSQEVQQVVLRGVVTNAKEEPLAGVSVQVKGDVSATSTSDDGRFEILLPQPKGILIFSAIGFAEREISIQGQSDVSVVLEEKLSDLEEVIVVGYGTQQRKNLSGAVATVPKVLMTNRPVMNVGQALQGTVANLSVNVGNGRADASPTFNIRGQNSINSTDGPMIVIDGIIMDAAALNSLNPQDIENVSVLKDAASAAIYGSRAAFGVILVTTKSGKTDKPQISYSNNFVAKQPTYRPEIVEDPYTNFFYSNQMGDYQFSAQVLEYAQQLQADPSLPKFMEFGGSWTYFGSTNWYNEIFKKDAFSTQHGIEVSGKSDRFNYMLSGNYLHEDGLLKPASEDFDRYNLRNKIDFKVTDWWTVGNNTSFMRNRYARPSSFSDDFLFYSQTMGSYELVVNPEGGWSSGGVQSVGSLIDGGDAVTTNNLFQTSFNTKLSLIKDVLDIQGNFAYTNNLMLNQWSSFPVPYKRGPSLPYMWRANSSAARGTAPRTQLYTDVFANFGKTFAGKHAVNAMVGYSQESYRNQYLYYDRVGLVTPSFPTPHLATGAISLQETVTKWAMRSGFARLNYIFDDKYIVEINSRYDGSSRFPKGKRFVFNPSASAAWVLSNESFLSGLKPAISYLKVRASYGQLANQASSVFGYLPNMGFSRLNGMLEGVRPMTVAAPGLVSGDYTWEKVITRNIGLDVNFLNDRLTFSGDAYIRDTKDMLTKAGIYPGVLGAASPNVNGADLETKGWELNLGWRDQFSLANDEFRYHVNVLLSDNRTWITKFENETGTLGDFYVGKELGELWGLTTLGYFESDADIAAHADQAQVSSNAHPLAPGDLKFADLNGDGKINRGQWTLDDPGDFSVIGNSTARYNFGVNLYGAWKGFDVSMFFQGIGQRNFYPTYTGRNVDYEFFSYYATQWTHLTPHMLDNHWTPERTDAFYPRLKPGIAGTSGREMAIDQTKYLQNAAYVRLKNLSIGYVLPANATKTIGLSRVRVFASGDNLFTWSKLPKFYQVDPELAGRAGNGGGIAYSLQRVYSFGLNVTF